MAATKKIDPVVHFEMPAEDRKRMAKFYNQAFGWKTKMLGEEMGNYVLATTAAELDKKGRPKKTGPEGRSAKTERGGKQPEAAGRTVHRGS